MVTRLKAWVVERFSRALGFAKVQATAAYKVTDVFSTSSLYLPEAQRPGANAADIVQAMPEELLVFVLANLTATAAHPTLQALTFSL